MKLEAFTLWTNPARTRYVLIPDGMELPAGSFALCTITGGKREADEASLSNYEVSEEQAKLWLKSEFGKILESTREAAEQLVANLRARTAALDNDKAQK